MEYFGILLICTYVLNHRGKIMPEKVEWMCSKIKIRLVTADLRALSSPEPECECRHCSCSRHPCHWISELLRIYTACLGCAPHSSSQSSKSDLLELSILFVPPSLMHRINLRQLALSGRKERLDLTFLFPDGETARSDALFLSPFGQLLSAVVELSNHLNFAGEQKQITPFSLSGL